MIWIFCYTTLCIIAGVRKIIQIFLEVRLEEIKEVVDIENISKNMQLIHIVRSGLEWIV